MVAVVSAFVAVLPALAAGHETDQYTVPLGREFADLRYLLSRSVYEDITAAVEKTNALIRESLRDGTETEETRRLRSPEVIAKAVHDEFPYVAYHVEAWEIALRSGEVKARFPGMVIAYKPAFWIYHHPLLVIDPTKLVRLRRTSTIMVDGTYFGTDKFPHFFDMGYIYYKTYRGAINEGLGEAEATSRAVSLSAGGHFIYSESAILGIFTTGVRSNADLAANYVGMKFFRNLTEEVALKGRARPPMLLLDGPYWRLNDHVGPNSDFFSVFVSDHFNEALNPNSYLLGTTTFVKRMLRGRCEGILAWYLDDRGQPRTKEEFEEIARELSTYYGEDYGHSWRPGRMATVADTCFEGGGSAAGPGPAGAPEAASPEELAGNSVGEISGAHFADRFGRTALWWAARYGRIDEAKRLIGLGADVNAADIDGEGPLHQAARWGHADIAGELLSRGADAGAGNLYGATPLHLASRELQRDVVRVLLERGADPNARDAFGSTPLHDIAARGDESLAVLLVAAGADPSAGDALGTTPLHRAARAGNAGIAAMLLSSGASIEARNALGKTPLDEASEKDREALERLFSGSGGPGAGLKEKAR